MNLVGNAIKYTPEGGKVAVEVKKGEGEAKIFVSDNGVGISQQDQGHLFEKFFRNLGIPNIMAKKNFHELAHLVPENRLDPEIKEKLEGETRVGFPAVLGLQDPMAVKQSLEEPARFLLGL